MRGSISFEIFRKLLFYRNQINGHLTTLKTGNSPPFSRLLPEQFCTKHLKHFVTAPALCCKKTLLLASLHKAFGFLPWRPSPTFIQQHWLAAWWNVSLTFFFLCWNLSLKGDWNVIWFYFRSWSKSYIQSLLLPVCSLAWAYLCFSHWRVVCDSSLPPRRLWDLCLLCSCSTLHKTTLLLMLCQL